MFEVRAADVETAGFPRLAASMRELGASYRQDAQRIRAEHRAEA